jgi:peptidoglycan hydrolase-like protein with peptidoglycan-binding domain
VNQIPMQQEQHRTPVFGYGSNNIAQLRRRCQNPHLLSIQAKLNGFARCFAGSSPSRQNAAVATVVQTNNATTYGSIVYLTPTELERLDVFEGCHSHQPNDPDPTINTYRREQLEVIECHQQEETPVQAWTYIRNNTQWVPTGSHGGRPSPQYLTLIKENIEQHWRETGGVTITIRRADTLEIVEEWSGKHLAPLTNPIDGNFGPTTQRALQQFLLSQELCNGQKETHLAAVDAPVDGRLGPVTVRALQQFLLDLEQGKIEIKRRDGGQ